MNFSERIEQLIKHGSTNVDKQFEEINFLCVYEFKWSYDQLMKTPIPFVISILKQHKKFKEEEKKANRRR